METTKRVGRVGPFASNLEEASVKGSRIIFVGKIGKPKHAGNRRTLRSSNYPLTRSFVIGGMSLLINLLEGF